MTKSELASELGKLGRGVKKTMSKAAIKQRSNAGKLRWKNHKSSKNLQSVVVTA